MRIVCDTNVLISGVLFNGPPRRVLELIARGAIDNAVSLEILAEVKNVLLRPEFGLSSEQVTDMVATFAETFSLVAPGVQVDAVKDDPDDDRILEAAQTAHARVIVSGDQHLLSIKAWREIEILSPAVFMERFG
jgi:putative PIN family toxin of toxin-antitoxin system